MPTMYSYMIISLGCLLLFRIIGVIKNLLMRRSLPFSIFIVVLLAVEIWLSYLFYIGIEKLGEQLIRSDRNLIPSGENTLPMESVATVYFGMLLRAFFVIIPVYGIVTDANIFFVRNSKVKRNIHLMLLSFGFTLLLFLNIVHQTYVHFRGKFPVGSVFLANALIICVLIFGLINLKTMKTDQSNKNVTKT